MSNVRILYNSDIWDAAAVSGSMGRGDLGSDNVLNDYIGWPAAFSGGDGALVFDLDAASTITCFGVFGHNWTAGTTVVLMAHTSNAWTSPDLTTSITIATDADSQVLTSCVVFPTANNNKRWWRLSWTGSTVFPVTLGRIKAGAYYELPRNPNDGFAFSFADASEGAPVAGTLVAFREQPIYRQLAVDFSLVNTTQRRKFEAMFRKVGNHKPVVVCVEPDTYPSEQSMYCRLITPMNVVYDVINYHSAGTLVFEEITR
jgi:hypothetical protein